MAEILILAAATVVFLVLAGLGNVILDLWIHRKN